YDESSRGAGGSLFRPLLDNANLLLCHSVAVGDQPVARPTGIRGGAVALNSPSPPPAPNSASTAPPANRRRSWPGPSRRRRILRRRVGGALAEAIRVLDDQG